MLHMEQTRLFSPKSPACLNRPSKIAYTDVTPFLSNLQQHTQINQRPTS